MYFQIHINADGDAFVTVNLTEHGGVIFTDREYGFGNKWTAV